MQRVFNQIPTVLFIVAALFYHLVQGIRKLALLRRHLHLIRKWC